MAGQLTIDTLKASSGVLATQNGMTGITKAWINFNGNTSTIRNSFNISSITRVQAGCYTVTFSTAMPNSTYVPNVSWSPDNGSTVYVTYGSGLFSTDRSSLNSPPTTSGFGFYFNWPTSGYPDPTYVMVSVNGN